MAIPYHPNFFNPSLGVQRQHCGQRLHLIKPWVGGSVLDIGCSEGYFSFGVAEQAQAVLGIDWKQSLIDICIATGKGRVENVGFIRADLESWVKTGVQYDTTLYLSVHHHIMGCHGMKAAAAILAKIMDNTKGNLLFDIGQKNEFHKGVNNWWKILPDGDPDEWIRGLLKDAGATTIEKLGAFEFAGAMRGLWVASR